MSIKEEIFKNAGLKESVIIREEPPKPPKKKKKVIKERIKLNSLLNDLLLEAVDLSDGSKIIRALERGQVPNVKKKEFLKTSFTKDQIEETLNELIGIVTEKVGADANKYLMLIMKRAGNIEYLDQFNKNELNEIIDSMIAYFGNKNKKEAKENVDVKKKFEEYENSQLSFEKDKEFEQWVNEKFAHKAKAKDKDIDVVYDDGEWNVSIPKTFAAASKLACMADRKAHWCTSANKGMFKHYTNDGTNPLFIIRNEKRNLMYQMDWGRGRRPNFMDEQDDPINAESVLNKNIPENLWKAIKNSEGTSVYDKLEPILKEKENKIPLDDTNKTPEEELDGWNEQVFITLDDFMDDVEGKDIPNIFKDSSRMRDILSGDYSKGTGGAKRIAKYTKNGESYYHIVPKGTLNVRTDDKAKIVLKINGNELLYVRTNELLNLGLPKFFTDDPLSNTKKTEGDMNGWNEYIYSSAGEFLREIKDYQMPNMIKNVRTLTQILKGGGENVSQIGKVTKGKKTYYYLIAKPNFEIVLGTRPRKSFERVAFGLSGNKLSIKTAKSIANSDLPEVLKEKLFTSYSYPSMREREEGKKTEEKSISGKELKKPSNSEIPTLVHEQGQEKVYNNANTFGRIMNVPNIGEKAIESIKQKVMGGQFKPSNVLVMVSTTENMSSKKIKVFVMKDGETYETSVDGFFPSYYFHKNRNLSYDLKKWLWDTYFKNSSVFSNEEKEVFKKIMNAQPIHKFKDGAELKMGYNKPFILKDGKEYHKRAVYDRNLGGGRGYIYQAMGREGSTLPDEYVVELYNQGLEKYEKLIMKMGTVQ
ncbi:MAG: hypothetical protein ACOC1P_05135 [Minisyncoccales bacterium]